MIWFREAKQISRGKTIVLTIEQRIKIIVLIFRRRINQLKCKEKQIAKTFSLHLNDYSEILDASLLTIGLKNIF